MDKSENGRISRRVGWVDEQEYPYYHNSTWKQKVLDHFWLAKEYKNILNKRSFFFDKRIWNTLWTQGTRIAVKTIGTLSMIALFIWQVCCREQIFWVQVVYLSGSIFDLFPWLSFEGKPCSGQVCQQADQPPRKAPGFLPIWTFQHCIVLYTNYTY